MDNDDRQAMGVPDQDLSHGLSPFAGSDIRRRSVKLFFDPPAASEHIKKR